MMRSTKAWMIAALACGCALTGWTPASAETAEQRKQRQLETVREMINAVLESRQARAAKLSPFKETFESMDEEFRKLQDIGKQGRDVDGTKGFDRRTPGNVGNTTLFLSLATLSAYVHPNDNPERCFDNLYVRNASRGTAGGMLATLQSQLSARNGRPADDEELESYREQFSSCQERFQSLLVRKLQEAIARHEQVMDELRQTVDRLSTLQQQLRQAETDAVSRR
ncbi:MAG: hypothetical protein HY554_12840 [Elusimicrobia bacterium]|nr:hypothetical protein [Elusimicrobiota bacterium]